MSSADAVSCVVTQSLLAGRTLGGLSPCVRIKSITEVSVGHPLGWEKSLLTAGWLEVRGQTWELLLQHEAGGCFYKERGHKHPALLFGAAGDGCTRGKEPGPRL